MEVVTRSVSQEPHVEREESTRSTGAWGRAGGCRPRFGAVVLKARCLGGAPGSVSGGNTDTWPERHELKQMMKIHILFKINHLKQ